MQALAKIAGAIDAINETAGRWAAWLAIGMMLLQFTTVLLRYVFSVSFTALNESIWYLHGLLFTTAAGYALLHDAHVRIDILYARASERRKAWIDIAGSLLFLIPLCGLTLWLSSSYVLNAWQVLEGSIERSGLPLIFLLKTAIWVFAGLLLLQAVSVVLKSSLILLRQPNDISPAIQNSVRSTTGS